MWRSKVCLLPICLLSAFLLSCIKTEASPFATIKIGIEEKTTLTEERECLGQRKREERKQKKSDVEQKKSNAEQKKLDARQRKSDAEQLAKALDYFTSRKYHECLLILQPLNERYKLNPRYKAYLGVCYYYEWDYEQTCALLDESMPQLQGFAPQERSLYYWMDAESHFNLQRYQEAMPLYGEMLKLCHENERPDAYYRLGFCHLYQAKSLEDGKKEDMLGELKLARQCFEQALAGYLKYRNTPEEKARIAQIQHMMNGLK